jgi:hypothetical protein
MLFLAPGASGPEVITELTGGEAGGQRAGGPTTSKEHKKVQDLIAAAKVERAASAGRIASVDACFHLCMYSPDTLHPSPKNIRQKRPLRSVHETVHK